MSNSGSSEPQSSFTGKGLMARFREAYSRIENLPHPLHTFIILFFAILGLRLTLEFFSSRRLFSGEDVLHIGLWFVFIVLAFLLQLQFFSREDAKKVAKLVVVCFSFSLSAPLLDLIFSAGQGVKMNYLSLNSAKDVFWAYFTVGGASLSRGATPGIRIEILILVWASFQYVRMKTGRLSIALLAAFCIYSVLFFSGALPLLMNGIVSVLGLQYGSDDRSTILLLLCFDLFLFGIALFRFFPDRMRNCLKTIQWASVLLAIVLFVMGALLAHSAYPLNWQPDPTRVFWFPLLIFWAGMMLLFFSLVRIVPDEASLRMLFALSALILFTASQISSQFLFLAAVSLGIEFLLYQPPLYLGRIPILGRMLEACGCALISMSGFVAFQAPMIGFPSPLLFILLLSGFLLGCTIHPPAGFKSKLMNFLCIAFAYVLAAVFISGIHPESCFLLLGLPLTTIVYHLGKGRIIPVMLSVIPALVFIFILLIQDYSS